MSEEIYLTERSILELLQGKDIYEDDGRVIIHPPKTHELIEVVGDGKINLR